MRDATLTYWGYAAIKRWGCSKCGQRMDEPCDHWLAMLKEHPDSTQVVLLREQNAELRRLLKKAAHQIGTTDEELVAEIRAILSKVKQ